MNEFTKEYLESLEFVKDDFGYGHDLKIGENILLQYLDGDFSMSIFCEMDGNESYKKLKHPTKPQLENLIKTLKELV